MTAHTVSPYRPLVPRPRGVLIAGGATIAALLLLPAILELRSAAPFHPHGYCYLWQPGLVALHVVSDLLIGLSYVSISATLVYLIYRGRRQIPFSWVFLAFGLFIVACGATHFMEVWTLWNATYWLSGDVKLITAFASVATAVVLPPLVPKVLHLVEASTLSEQRRLQLEEAHRQQTASFEEMKRARDVLQQAVASQDHDVGELAAELALQKRQVQSTLEELRQAHIQREQLLTREQTARQQAETANRAKDAFLATVSHELRTPLSPILAWARMLQQGMLDTDKSQQALTTIERNAKSLAQLIEDLLDVSRITDGNLRLDVRPVELAPVIRAAVDVVRPAADAKGIDVQTVLDSEAGSVSGDAQRLQQVVWNLLSNAVKFTPRGGRVLVMLERVNSHVEIAVSDTGQGIDAAFLPHVFERFRQADSTSRREHAGLGLGLTIVRHIVELHGGSVHAESPGEGRGAVFTVKLPLIPVTRTAGELERRHPKDGLSASTAALTYARLDTLRVLLVDDEPDSNEAVRLLLSSCGAEVRTAASALQALAILERWKPDVLVSDIGMPGEDGYALIAKVRAHTELARLPAIALTAYASVDDRIRLLSAGFQMHVTKPVEPAELVTVVANLADTAGARHRPA